ncbi:MAG: 4Fe-4S dicluster domain-containing protein [Rubrivivax sp.]|nr:4Fe-4S dicluster domain-containing protein [Rubrivivax sp.]
MARSTARVPLVLSQRCTGCGRCVGACDLHLLSLHAVQWKKSAVLQDAHRCTGCSDCARVCPFQAIRMRAATITSPAPD